MRLRVAEEMVCPDRTRSQVVARMFDQTCESLGCKSLSPVGDADPVPDGIIVIRLKIGADCTRFQADRADERAVRAQGDGVLLGSAQDSAYDVEALRGAFMCRPACRRANFWVAGEREWLFHLAVRKSSTGPERSPSILRCD